MSDIQGNCEDIVDVLADCQDLQLWGLYRNMLHFSDVPVVLFRRFFALELAYRARERLFSWPNYVDRPDGGRAVT
ncbi:MAG: hypothetical protein ABSB63_15930 [Spirochaetia bacterium]